MMNNRHGTIKRVAITVKINIIRKDSFLLNNIISFLDAIFLGY